MAGFNSDKTFNDKNADEDVDFDFFSPKGSVSDSERKYSEPSKSSTTSSSKSASSGKYQNEKIKETSSEKDILSGKQSSRTVSSSSTRSSNTKDHTRSKNSLSSHLSKEKSHSKSSKSSTVSEKKKSRTPSPVARARSSSSDSNATVTDISSLSTDSESETGPHQRKKIAPLASPTHKDSYRALSARDQDIINSEQVMRAMLTLNQERQRDMYKARQPWISPVSKTRPVSLSINAEVEGNTMKRRLLEGYPALGGSMLVHRPYHSTVNRQRQQRKIEIENKKKLSFLTGCGPSVGMRCSDQLTFYGTQSNYGVIQVDKLPFKGTRITFNPLRVPGSSFDSHCKSKPEQARKKKKRTSSQKSSSSTTSSIPPITLCVAPPSRREWKSGW